MPKSTERFLKRLAEYRPSARLKARRSRPRTTHSLTRSHRSRRKSHDSTRSDSKLASADRRASGDSPTVRSDSASYIASGLWRQSKRSLMELAGRTRPRPHSALSIDDNGGAGMLILTRKFGESLMIGDLVKVTVLGVNAGRSASASRRRRKCRCIARRSTSGSSRARPRGRLISPRSRQAVPATPRATVAQAWPGARIARGRTATGSTRRSTGRWRPVGVGGRSRPFRCPHGRGRAGDTLDRRRDRDARRGRGAVAPLLRSLPVAPARGRPRIGAKWRAARGHGGGSGVARESEALSTGAASGSFASSSAVARVPSRISNSRSTSSRLRSVKRTFQRPGQPAGGWSRIPIDVISDR